MASVAAWPPWLSSCAAHRGRCAQEGTCGRPCGAHRVCEWRLRLNPAQGIVDDALRKVTAGGHEVPTVLVFDHARAAKRADVPFVPGRDAWWQDEVAGQPTTCAVEWMGAEEPLFKACCSPYPTLSYPVAAPLHPVTSEVAWPAAVKALCARHTTAHALFAGARTRTGSASAADERSCARSRARAGRRDSKACPVRPKGRAPRA